MRTETRLEKYQEQLKTPLIPGGLICTLLSSTRFTISMPPCRDIFCCIFFGSLILMTAGYAAVRSLWVIPLVMLGTRIVNAFSADRIRLRHIRRFIERNQDVNYSRPVIFYPVPVKRLLISSVVSGGLYQIYWMYKKLAGGSARYPRQPNFSGRPGVAAGNLLYLSAAADRPP